MGSICFEEKFFWTFLVWIAKGIVLFDLGKNRADEKGGGETISYPFPFNGFLPLIWLKLCTPGH